jgi:type IV fimbrial biogenesis protein FimT
MKRLVPMIKRGGFTLVELMVVVAVVAVVLMMAAPSFRDLIFKQRLMGTADQFMTDVQFARTEAASRQATTHLRFKTVTDGMTCYIVHTCSPASASVCTCDCSAAPGSRCSSADDKELRTVQLARGEGVTLFPVNLTSPANLAANSAIDAEIAFDPATGSALSAFATSVYYVPPPPQSNVWVKVGKLGATTGPSIRVVINRAGRPQSCAQGGGSYSGMGACQP